MESFKRLPHQSLLMQLEAAWRWFLIHMSEGWAGKTQTAGTPQASSSLRSGHSLSSRRALGKLDILPGDSGFKVAWPGRAPGRSFISFYGLTSEVAQCHFCFILFMGRGIRLCLLVGVGLKNLQTCSKRQNALLPPHIKKFWKLECSWVLLC